MEVPPDACKILFIGNSLTYFNDQPDMVKSFAEAAGHTVFVEQATIGGATLADHAASSWTLSVIDQQDWDYVVLQQSIMHVAFPRLLSSVAGPIESLKAAIGDGSSDARIVYFLDYPMKEGVYWFDQYYTYEASQQMLYDGTLAIAVDFDMEVAPVGWAWNAVVRDRPDIELYDIDNAHPSHLGSYLGAAVYYATIFRDRAAASQYDAGINIDAAEYLSEVASGIVLDSLDVWYLSQNAGACATR